MQPGCGSQLQAGGGKSPQHPTTSLWGWVLSRDTGTLPPPGIPSWGWLGASIPLHSPKFLLPGGCPRCVPAVVMPTPMGRDVLELPSSVIVMGTRSGKQQEASPKSCLPGGLCRQEMIQGSADTRQKMMLQLPWHRCCWGAAVKEGETQMSLSLVASCPAAAGLGGELRPPCPLLSHPAWP